MTNLTVLMAINKIDEFTDDAIKSILNQTYDDFIFIIVINGSDSDNIYSYLIKNFDDSRIKYLFSSLPGLANALNYGLQHIDTTYLARMDSDDISSLDRFEEQINFMNNHPDIDVLGSKIDLIDQHNNVLPDKFFFAETSKKIKFLLPILNTLCHPVLMFKTESIKKVGGYKFGFHSEDHELFLRMLNFPNNDFNFYNINKILLSYRRHPNQLTSKNTKKISSEVGSFLYMYFFKTFNLKYIFGIFLITRPILFLKKSIRLFLRKKFHF